MAKEIKTTVGAFGRTVIWLGVIGAVALVAMFAIHTAKKFIPDAQMAVIATNGECLASVPKDRTAITLRVRTFMRGRGRSICNSARCVRISS